MRGYHNDMTKNKTEDLNTHEVLRDMEHTRKCR